MNNMLKCKFCGKICKNGNSLRNHERLCKLNPERQFSYFSNNKWQKEKGTNQYIKAKKEGRTIIISEETRKKLSKSSKGRKHTIETKEKISKKLSIVNKGGRCKWYTLDGQKIQGTWELNFAKKCKELNIKWDKIKTNAFTFVYVDENFKKHHYTPDFFLEEYNLFIEIKGFWWGNDKQKMNWVIQQNNLTNLIVIEKIKYEKLLLTKDKEEFIGTLV